MKTKEQVLTNNLRNVLKNVMQGEIEKLPETLNQLEPKEKMEIICKLMPFVFPKVETINSCEGEPVTW